MIAMYWMVTSMDYSRVIDVSHRHNHELFKNKLWQLSLMVTLTECCYGCYGCYVPGRHNGGLFKYGSYVLGGHSGRLFKQANYC